MYVDAGFKFGLIGKHRGPAPDPLKPFLKEGLKNPKNFQKALLVNAFLKF